MREARWRKRCPVWKRASEYYDALCFYRDLLRSEIVKIGEASIQTTCRRRCLRMSFSNWQGCLRIRLCCRNLRPAKRKMRSNRADSKSYFDGIGRLTTDGLSDVSHPLRGRRTRRTGCGGGGGGGGSAARRRIVEWILIDRRRRWFGVVIRSISRNVGQFSSIAGRVQGCRSRCC